MTSTMKLIPHYYLSQSFRRSSEVSATLPCRDLPGLSPCLSPCPCVSSLLGLLASGLLSLLSASPLPMLQQASPGISSLCPSG